MEQSLCSKNCVVCNSPDYLTYKTKQNLNFPFHRFSHLFIPNQFFDKKKRTGVKTEQLKYLRDFTRTRVQKSRGFLECVVCQLTGFFTVKGNHFPFMARIRIPTVLLGKQYNYTKTVPIGKANHHLFLNFPALAKTRSCT